MTKPTITKVWLAGVIVLAAGLVAGGVSLGLMLAYGGHFVAAASENGYDFIPSFDPFFWTMVGLMVTGFIIAAAGAIVQLVAWIGALVNTYPLQDKTWFVVLLAGGVLSLVFAPAGFAAMVAYVIAGPDGTLLVQQPPLPSPDAPDVHIPTPVPMG